MRYYPLFLDISRRLCVVVGGGNVAERKVERLLACGARVEVVGKTLTPMLAALARGRGGSSTARPIMTRILLPGAFLVIGATDNEAVNGRIAKDARARGIPVNIVDDPARCDFILPSVVERGDLADRRFHRREEPRPGQETPGGAGGGLWPGIRRSARDPGGAPGEGDRRGTFLRRESGTFRGRCPSEILDHIRRSEWKKVKETDPRTDGRRDGGGTAMTGIILFKTALAVYLASAVRLRRSRSGAGGSCRRGLPRG